MGLHPERSRQRPVAGAARTAHAGAFSKPAIVLMGLALTALTVETALADLVVWPQDVMAKALVSSSLHRQLAVFANWALYLVAIAIAAGCLHVHGCKTTACSRLCGSSRPAVVSKLSSPKTHHCQVTQALRKGDPQEAAELLGKRGCSSERLDVALHSQVVHAFAKKGDACGAERMLEQMLSAGFDVPLLTYNAVLDACAQSDQPNRCEGWLCRMCDMGVKGDTISYSTTMSAFARQGDRTTTENCFQQMLSAGLTPDTSCYNALVHVCSTIGDVRAVERWIDEMQVRGLAPSVTAMTSAIGVCARAGEVTRAEFWLQRMLSAGLSPNVVSYSAVMDACAKAGDPARAELWYDRMIQAGVQPNCYSFSSIINACARVGDAVEADRWLARAEQTGTKIDPVVYSCVIDACGRAGLVGRAKEVFHEMKAKGFTPHIVTYAALARPLAHRGDWIAVEKIAQDMEDAGVKVNDYFLYAQLLAYASAQPKQGAKAEAAFRRAMAMGVQTNAHVHHALLRAVGQHRTADLMSQFGISSGRSQGRHVGPTRRCRAVV